MTLREKIELAIREAQDLPDAAVLVMGLLEVEGLGVGGNGWVEDDPLLVGEGGEWVPFNEACERWTAIAARAATSA